jgi:hypothetical protein
LEVLTHPTHHPHASLSVAEAALNQTNQRGELLAAGSRREGQFSTNCVPSPLWGFRFGDTNWGSSTLASLYESLHDADLGVFLYLVNSIKAYLSSKRAADAPALMRALNERSLQLFRGDDFYFPCPGKVGGKPQ